MIKSKEPNRQLQVQVPGDILILLSKLITKRLASGVRPSLANKSTIVAEAISGLAAVEGVSLP